MIRRRNRRPVSMDKNFKEIVGSIDKGDLCLLYQKNPAAFKAMFNIDSMRLAKVAHMNAHRWFTRALKAAKFEAYWKEQRKNAFNEAINWVHLHLEIEKSDKDSIN